MKIRMKARSDRVLVALEPISDKSSPSKHKRVEYPALSKDLRIWFDDEAFNGNREARVEELKSF